MNQYEHNHHDRAPSPRRIPFSGIFLGVVLALTLFQISGAARPQSCEVNEERCRVSAGFSAVSADADGLIDGITAASSSAFGALIYPDYKALEAEARAALKRGLELRESISPYRDNNDFDTFLRELDYQSGFDAPYTGSLPDGTGKTLNQVVQEAEDDLRKARDLYAFLVVHGPDHRFRADGDYSAALCAFTEDPYPADPDFTGQVLPPVIDWCDFRARLRQSVREATNIRMIFGQEFMVDALGVNFSGNFFGGEEMVEREVARLRAAKNQFELAETFLASALKKSVGSGCLISDFYTQTEWALLSRASEMQGNAQYHIASRLSYLGVGSPQSVPQAQDAAQGEFRRSAIDGYIKLIGLAGLGGDTTPSCAAGERPDGNLVADMAINLLETQRESAEMADGRNIFGFDVTQTPARHYKSSIALNCNTAAGERGLWDEAKCAAENARSLQIYEEDKTRFFEASQTSLRDAVDDIRQGLDTDIYNVTGCDRNAVASDAPYFTCVETQIAAIETCLGQAHLDSFDTCMNSVNTGTDSRTALYNLNSVHQDYLAIKKAAANIDERIRLSNDANATVTDAIGLTGISEGLAAVSAAALDAISCIDFSDLGSGTGQSTVPCAAAGVNNGIQQGLAVAATTLRDIDIADAENKQETENLLLDLTELVLQAKSAHQNYFSQKSDVQGMLDGLNRDYLETQRQRAYFDSSPANDPSFRIVRDSARIALAKELEKSAQIAYLAARRAEYEYANSLYKYDFRISDIYRARTADDIIVFLNGLQNATNNMAGAANADNEAFDMPTISVAKHVLQLTDDVLMSEGFTTPAAIEAERTRRFRLWVADNTELNTSEGNGKPILRFNMTTSLFDSGLFSNLILQGYDSIWRLQLGGKGEPYAENTGVSVNLVTAQTDADVTYRSISMTQGGLSHLKSLAGCVYDYRLVEPAVMLGSVWPSNQNSESTTATFSANINDINPYALSNFRTGAFEGRPISATDWEVLVRAGAPTVNQSDMNLQLLTDIELDFSAVKSSRTAGAPDPADCVRIDW